MGTADKLISIKWLSDGYDCDCCGGSWADGAEVRLNDDIILNLIPHAHCFGGAHWDTADVYKEILKTLGYEITED